MTATRPPGFDDRFSTPIEASRRGAHRARPKPASATLPVLAGIAVILIVVMVGYSFAKGDGTDDSKSNQLAASAGDDPTVTAKPPANAASAGKATATKAPASGDTTDNSGEGDTSTDVDHSIKLKVLNSTSTQGLAKRVAADIEGDDWTVTGTGDSRNRNLSVTKIYYGKDSVRATAEAVRKDLGYGTVVKDASVTTTGITVVVGFDAS